MHILERIASINATIASINRRIRKVDVIVSQRFERKQDR